MFKSSALLFSIRFSFVVATGTLFLALSAGMPARSSVEVDFSVLEDGDFSTQPSSTSFSRHRGSGPRMPGTVYPKSVYTGPPVRISVPGPAPRPATDVTLTAPVPVAVSGSGDAASLPEPEVSTVPDSRIETDSTTETVATEQSANTEPVAITPPPEPAIIDVVPTTTATGSMSAEPARPAQPEGEQVEVSPGAARQIASLGVPATGKKMRVVFRGEETELPDGAAEQLDPLATQVTAGDNIRIQLRAYAGGENVSASKARRLSLSRALAVRSYLIEQGVRSTRIDVRALGDKSDETPVNRVDIEIGEL